ncbi:MAG TPA: glycoside hydrolase family 18 protein [Actinocrinis sp.]|uniref:glycoside hydrolase family 18 protein n=1 Tax=Actinocrinis sp. TaxID=1920516 RepID=UPI002DDCD468|nr:glycoside hydrolase family 18 protein [Actinocrinis sp.]HEV2344408.1 glycoside hydrolase family 18 protein [Actinocrinis sp.]
MRDSTNGTTADRRPTAARRRLAGIAAAGALLAAAAPAAHAASFTADHPEGPGGGKAAIGFFTQWGIYSGFFEKNLIADGAAAKLTEINYAFSSVSPDGQCTSGDSWADYQRPFAASEAVDGVADAPGQALAGNFNQLKELKAAYPKLKIVISIGGWSWSSQFSALASTEAGRQKFVQSCVDQYINGNIPGLPAGAAKGIFDGIDLDWEYPNEPGNNNPYGPQDTPDFTALAQDFRGALNAAGESSDTHYLLTADTSPNQYAAAQQLQLAPVAKSLDWYNVMTLDFHGGWDAKTDFGANLLPDPNDPQPANGKFSITQTVAYYESHGVPARKIALELPYYAHAWTGVAATNNGLYQSATGAASTDQAGYKTVITEPGAVHYDPVTASIWKYDPASQTFWTYDNPSTVFAKGLYIDIAGLRGASVWSLDGDDANGSLTSALTAALR